MEWLSIDWNIPCHRRMCDNSIIIVSYKNMLEVCAMEKNAMRLSKLTYCCYPSQSY